MRRLEPFLPKPNLTTPVRNRYFYGKLLDAYHFELETNYANSKRWLINRHVIGYGVVCGLDVRGHEHQPRTIVITPGLAIDKWGREIIVPKETQPIVIPDEVIEQAIEMGGGRVKQLPPVRPEGGKAKHEREHQHVPVQVLLCYHECETDPVPVLTGECHPSGPCAPGAIREQYSVKFKPGAAEPFQTRCRIPDLFSGGELDYRAMATWISRNCHEVAKDPCVVLANVCVPVGDPCPCETEHIDIAVRRIVYSNDLLFDILLELIDLPTGNDEK